MEVRNCKGCRRLFNYLSGPQLCPACVKKLEGKFAEVKEYLEENPKATMQQISEDNDVSVKQIKQWVREERLYFSDDSPYGIECEMCGKMIKSGRFCNECRGQMANTFQKAIDKPKPTSGNNSRVLSERDKMRYLDK